MKRHVGKIKNTDRRCIVVYLQIPGREDHALVIDTDALPDKFHDGLFQVVDSIEGQNETVLANLLSRRIMPHMGGVDIMNALHGSGFLQAVPIDNILMVPEPNRPMPLRTILEHMNKIEKKVEQLPDPEHFNRFEEEQNKQTRKHNYDVAQNLLRSATLLESEVIAKRKEAYRLYPELDPSYVSPGIVSLPEKITSIVDDYYIPEIPATPSAIPKDYLNDDISDKELLERAQFILDRAAKQSDVVKRELETPKKPVGRPKKNVA